MYREEKINAFNLVDDIRQLSYEQIACTPCELKLPSWRTTVSYTHLDVYKRQNLLYIRYNNLSTDLYKLFFKFCGAKSGRTQTGCPAVCGFIQYQ